MLDARELTGARPPQVFWQRLERRHIGVSPSGTAVPALVYMHTQNTYTARIDTYPQHTPMHAHARRMLSRT